MNELAVQVDQVVRTFGDVRAVNDVSFHVEAGEVFGLLGHNGAGKTTLIRVLNGLLPPDSGTVEVLGLDPTIQGNQLRARTGVLTEYPALDDFLSPLENLAVYAAVHNVPNDIARQRASDLVEQLGLADHATQPARNLSAGLKQRLALARALIHDPEMLLLDEPTSNLDPLAARGVRDLVLRLSRERGRTVLLSTHNLIEAQGMCDRVGIIQHGRLLAVGSLSELSREMDRGIVHIQVDPDDVDAARTILEQYGGIDLAALSVPGGLEARLHHTEVPTVISHLVQADVAVHAVTPQMPTLEDVYVALHGHTSPTIPADLA